MRAIVLDPSFPVPPPRHYAPTRRAGLGSGAVQLRRRWQRPFYEFTISLPAEDRAVMESLTGFAAYHQGDIPFFFDGGEYGDIQNPIFVDFSDGARTQFFLPYRNVFAPSLVMYHNGAINSGWTLNEASGLVTFTSAPAAGEISCKCKCRYKCVFWYGDEAIYGADGTGERAPNVYDLGRIELREVP